jgi:SLA1 homology domain 1, SHD1
MRVIAGDFGENRDARAIVRGLVTRRFEGITINKWLPGWGKHRIHSSQIATAQIVTDDNERDPGAIGNAIVGGLLFGPIGAVVGGMSKGSHKKATFVVALVDGRRFLATGSVEEFNLILGASLRREIAESRPVKSSARPALGGLGRLLIVLGGCLAVVALYWIIEGQARNTPRTRESRSVKPSTGDIVEPMGNPSSRDVPQPAVEKSPDPSNVAESAEGGDRTSHERTENWRTWVDRTLTFTVEATYVGMVSDKVKLRKRDGTIIYVDYDCLYPVDQIYIQDARKTEGMDSADGDGEGDPGRQR